MKILAPNNIYYDLTEANVKNHIININKKIYCPISTGFGDFISNLHYIIYLVNKINKIIEIEFVIYGTSYEDPMGDSVEDKICYLLNLFGCKIKISFVKDPSINKGIFKKYKGNFDLNLYEYLCINKIKHLNQNIQSNNILYSHIAHLNPLKRFSNDNKNIGVWNMEYKSDLLMPNKYLDTHIFNYHVEHFKDLGYNIVNFNYSMKIDCFYNLYKTCSYIVTTRSGLAYFSKMFGLKKVLLITTSSPHGLDIMFKHFFYKVCYRANLYKAFDPKLVEYISI